jgi:hypothetical protein
VESLLAVSPRGARLLALGLGEVGCVGGVTGVVSEPDVCEVVLGGLVLGVLLVPELGVASHLPHIYLHGQD